MIQEVYNDSGTLISIIDVPVPVDAPIIVKGDKLRVLTSTDLQSLITAQALSPSYLYKISNTANWDVYVTALNSSVLDSIAFGVHQSTGTKAEIEYNVTTNTVVRVYDLSYYNWIEGATNINNFVWGNPNYAYNTIKNGGVFTNNGVINSFRFNLITDAATLIITNTSNVAAIVGNKILDAVTTIDNSNFHDFSYNTINSTITFKVNNSGTGNINNNVFTDLGATSLIYGSVTDFSFNTFTKLSSVSCTGIITVNTAITGNNVEGSTLAFIGNGTFDDFSYNNIKASSVSLDTPTFGSLTYNEITDSSLYIQNDTGITKCNIRGASSAVLDTAELYNGCIYDYNNESTFYVSYDFTNSTYYNSNTMIVNTGHTGIMGIFVATTKTTESIITSITNFPSAHKFILKNNCTGNIVITTAGGIKIITSAYVSTPITLVGGGTLGADFVKFDARSTPLGDGLLSITEIALHTSQVPTNTTTAISTTNATTLKTAAALAIALG